MRERTYLFIIGAFILLSLYLESKMMIYALCALLLFEGVTDIRITTLTQKISGHSVDAGLFVIKTTPRFKMDGLRAWRITVAIVLLSSYVCLHQFGYDVIWFFPWFMGFAILGAGVSGVCPVLLLLKRLGFS
jgi:hypothetical protein